MLLENGANRLAQHRVATNLQFVKIAMSAKHNKAKINKLTYAYIPEHSVLFNNTYLQEKIVAQGLTCWDIISLTDLREGKYSASGYSRQPVLLRREGKN